MKKKLLMMLIALISSGILLAGTLTLKDGKSVSGVKIVRIKDGNIFFKKNGKVTKYPLNKLSSYTLKDNDSLKDDNAVVENEFDEYKLSVIDVKLKKSQKKKKRDLVICDVEYSLFPQNDNLKKKRPYFYLYVLYKNKKDKNQVKCFSNISVAIPGGKGYDRSSIKKKLEDPKRKKIFEGKKKLKGGFEGRNVSIKLNGIKYSNIIAWHLEVWGNSKLVAEKNGSGGLLLGALRKPSGKWWTKYKLYR